MTQSKQPIKNEMSFFRIRMSNIVDADQLFVGNMNAALRLNIEVEWWYKREFPLTILEDLGMQTSMDCKTEMIYPTLK